MKKMFGKNPNKTEGSILTNIWRGLLKELDLVSVSKIYRLIDVYMTRHKANDKGSISIRSKNRTSITNDMSADAITWKTFLNLIFNVLRVKKMDITITIHHENKTTTTYSTTIKE